MDSAGFIVSLPSGTFIAKYESDFIKSKEAVFNFVRVLLRNTDVTDIHLHADIVGNIPVDLSLSLTEMQSMIVSSLTDNITVTGVHEDMIYAWCCDMTTWNIGLLCKTEEAIQKLLSHITEKGTWV